MSNTDKVVMEALAARIEQLTETVAALEQDKRNLTIDLDETRTILNNNLPNLGEHYQKRVRKILGYEG